MSKITEKSYNFLSTARGQLNMQRKPAKRKICLHDEVPVIKELGSKMAQKIDAAKI